jgi:hypothetical protein
LIARAREQFERQFARKDAEFSKRESSIRKMRDALAKTRKAIDAEIARKLRAERTSIAKSEGKKIRRALAGDLAERDRRLAELQRNLNANRSKLADAQKAQAEVMRKKRELDDAKRELDLKVEEKVQASLAKVRSSAKAEAEAHLKAKVLEKETQIAGMQRQIELLRRKADQGSQQLQGEAFERQVEALLRQQFPQDLFEPVRVGAPGGDLLHRVRNPAGQLVGAMLWECKQARSWNERWLAKLRDDQCAAKADIALIVSSALPKGVETFGLAGTIWVSAPRFAIPLAIALRQSLIEIANSRQTAAGQRSKMEMVYRYLKGPQFRHHIGAIIETFADMQADLDRERRTAARLWAKREAQLNAVIKASASFYGDLQGIAGQAIPEIESLNPIMIEDKSSLTATPAPTSSRSATKPSTLAACPAPSRNPPSGMDSCGDVKSEHAKTSVNRTICNEPRPRKMIVLQPDD